MTARNPRRVDRMLTLRWLAPVLFLVFCAFCWAASSQALLAMRDAISTACTGSVECAIAPRMNAEAFAALARVGLDPATAWPLFCIAVYAFAIVVFSVLGVVIAFGGTGRQRWFLAATWPALGFGPIAQFSDWPFARYVLPALGLAGFFWSLAAFPTLRIEPRWGRIPVLFGSGFAVIFFAFPPVVAALDRGEQPWWGLEGPAGLAATAGILAARMVRYRRSDATVRRYQGQLLVALGVVLALGAVGSIVAVIPGANDGSLLMAPLQLGGVVATTIIALVIAAATVAGRAYGVHIVVDHVLSGAALLALAALGYASVVAVASMIVPSGFAAAIAAITTALLLAGAIGRVLHGIDRLVYGDAAEPARLVAEVGRVAETTLSANGILPQMLAIAAEKLRLPALSLVLPDGETFEPVMLDGTGVPERGELIRNESLDLGGARGERFAVVRVSLRRGQRRLSRRDRAAVESLAIPFAAALAVRRLTAAAEAAQRRSIMAGERERVALRRRLHDGVGPALAAARYRLDAMAEDVPRLIETADPRERARTGSALRAQVASATVAVAEAYAQVRDVSRELRPPVLDEQGLATALAQYASDAGVRAHIDAGTVVEEPQRSVRYRIGIEAIANAVRHGGAQNVSIVIARNPVAVALQIADDGCGMPETFVPGVGMRSMLERVEVVGGSLRITANEAGGARVIATIPNAISGFDGTNVDAPEAQGASAW